jgi:hypothetical protein
MNINIFGSKIVYKTKMYFTDNHCIWLVIDHNNTSNVHRVRSRRNGVLFVIQQAYHSAKMLHKRAVTIMAYFALLSKLII